MEGKIDLISSRENCATKLTIPLYSKILKALKSVTREVPKPVEEQTEKRKQLELLNFHPSSLKMLLLNAWTKYKMSLSNLQTYQSRE
jgi:hypothetical protein